MESVKLLRHIWVGVKVSHSVCKEFRYGNCNPDLSVAGVDGYMC